MLRSKGLILLSFFLGSLSLYAQTTTTSLYPSKDCSASYLGTNVTASNNLELENSYTLLSNIYSRIFIQFDLSANSGIPEDAIITGATLKLPIISEAFTNLSVQRITSTWTETGAYTAPSFSAVNQQNTSTTTGIIYRNFDITAMVNDLRNGVNVNYGFMVRRTTESTVNVVNKYSSNESSGVKPELSITWYPRIKITSAVIVPASTTSALDGSITPTLTGGPGGSYTYNWAQDNGAFGSATTLNQSGLSKGCYYLKVTPPTGDIFYMAFLVGVKCEVTTIPFSRETDMHLYMDDAIVSMGSDILSNYGTSLSTLADKNLYLGVLYYTRSTFMRFRVWMPNTLHAVKADLALKGNGHTTSVGAPNTSSISLVDTNWEETKINGVNQPSSSGTSINLAATTSGAPNENTTIDIKDYWNVWRTSTNNGIVMKFASAVDAVSRRSYHSSDAATASNRPTITFVIDDAICDRTSYTQMKTELDGAYATTFLGKLKFYFDEEYAIDQGKKIPLKLYDENHQLIAGIDINGQAVSGQPLLPGLTYTFGDNRYLLDLTSHSLTNGKFYELELTRSTGEKLYMKFVYQN